MIYILNINPYKSKDYLIEIEIFLENPILFYMISYIKLTITKLFKSFTKKMKISK